jgi:hypothetical protein
MAAISSPWPPPKIIDGLVEKSSGYFIYATTIIKFIDDKNFRSTERLAVVTGMSDTQYGEPFAALDQLYTQILSGVHARPQLLKILMVIAASSLRLSIYSVEQLLELQQGDVRLALHGLKSVIWFSDQDDLNFVVFAHHASFCDFIQDRTRAGIFYVGGRQHRTELSRYILKAFSYSYDDPLANQLGHVCG